MKQLRGKPLHDFLRRTRRPGIDLVFLLQDIEDPVNVGAAFRIADACGVAEMILTGISARPPHPLIAKVGRGRDRQGSLALRRNRGRGHRPVPRRRLGHLRPRDHRRVGTLLRGRVPRARAAGRRSRGPRGHQPHLVRLRPRRLHPDVRQGFLPQRRRFPGDRRRPHPALPPLKGRLAGTGSGGPGRCPSRRAQPFQIVRQHRLQFSANGFSQAPGW